LAFYCHQKCFFVNNLCKQITTEIVNLKQGPPAQQQQQQHARQNSNPSMPNNNNMQNRNPQQHRANSVPINTEKKVSNENQGRAPPGYSNKPGTSPRKEQVEGRQRKGKIGNIFRKFTFSAKVWFL
jgi:hypothetical protein